MEHCRGGTLLNELVTMDGPLGEEVIIGIAEQLVAALCYLKSCNVIHRDIKLENILLTGAHLPGTKIPEIKLIDLGLSEVLAEGEKSVKTYGSLDYVAPEVLYQLPYDYQVDVYSLGVVIYAMCSQRVPFKRIN